MKPITYIVTAYDTTGEWFFLNQTLRQYSTYSKTVLQGIHFIVVDDCSPVPVRFDEDYNLNVTVLRIDDDIDWNQGGARNLGVDQAHTERVLLTDMDCLYPETTLYNTLHAHLAPQEICRFKRTTTISGKLDPHINSFLMHRKQYLAVGGVDEEFSGHYGYEDQFFLQQQKRHGASVTVAPDYLVMLTNAHTAVQATDPCGASRDLSRNRKLLEGKRAHSGLFINFTWNIVSQREIVI